MSLAVSQQIGVVSGGYAPPEMILRHRSSLRLDFWVLEVSTVSVLCITWEVLRLQAPELRSLELWLRPLRRGLDGRLSAGSCYGHRAVGRDSQVTATRSMPFDHEVGSAWRGQRGEVSTVFFLVFARSSSLPLSPRGHAAAVQPDHHRLLQPSGLPLQFPSGFGSCRWPL